MEFVWAAEKNSSRNFAILERVYLRVAGGIFWGLPVFVFRKLLRPIVEVETFDALEMVGVVGYELELARDCDTGN